MAKIPESSKLTLYSGVEITANEQLIFSSRANQTAYFNGKKIYDQEISQKEFSYLRKNGKLKVQLSYDKVQNVDYLSFINPAFENIRYYAKVYDWEYINNENVALHYAIDLFQTFMFDVNYEFATIEREHLSESDYQKSLNNPFDPSIFEFQTTEPLEVDKSMEEYYQREDLDDVRFYPITGTDPIANSSIVIFMSNFDTEDVPDFETFKTFFDQILMPNGDLIGSGGSVVGKKTVNVGRGYGLYRIDLRESDAYTRFQKALYWISFQGFTGAVLGIYQMTDGMWSGYLSAGSETTPALGLSPRDYDVQNKKLLLFPYQYVRVYNNSGAIKEYKYEKSKLVMNGEGAKTLRLEFIPIFDGVPQSSLVPLDYEMDGENIEERIDGGLIPQVGYTTDAFLSYLSKQNSQSLIDNGAMTFGNSVENMARKAAGNLMNGTVSERIPILDNAFGRGLTNFAGRLLDWMAGGGPGRMFSSAASGARSGSGTGSNVGRALTSAGSTALTPVNGAVGGGVIGAGLGMSGQGINELLNAPVAGMSPETEAKVWRSSSPPVISYYQLAKPAFAMDNYHVMSNNGTLSYYLANKPFPPGTFLIVRTKLRDEYLKIFDEFFSMYGYASGRNGLPRVCSYIKNTSGAAKPHFSTFRNKQITYIKTSQMHVIHAQQVVSSAIEEMFNSGIIFIKGD